MATEEYTTDDVEKVGKGAIKYDGGKPCIYRGLVQYFPRAGKAVAEISTFGANKYAWNGWEGVDDGINRYSDAMMRHFFYEAAGEEFDPDSGLRHAAHAAWGAMARLELILRDLELRDAWEVSEETDELVEKINTDPYGQAHLVSDPSSLYTYAPRYTVREELLDEYTN